MFYTFIDDILLCYIMRATSLANVIILVIVIIIVHYYVFFSILYIFVCVKKNQPKKNYFNRSIYINIVSIIKL